MGPASNLGIDEVLEFDNITIIIAINIIIITITIIITFIVGIAIIISIVVLISPAGAPGTRPGHIRDENRPLQRSKADLFRNRKLTSERSARITSERSNTLKN